MIKLVKSTFYKEQETKKQLINFISSAEKLSMGKECEKFEKKFSIYQKRKFCCFVNSGSSANMLLLQSLLSLNIISKNDKIAFSSLTWSTNVMPIIQLGFMPIPIDVSLTNLNITLESLVESYKNNPFKVLFVTNLLGLCGNLDEIEAFCKREKIILLEDNCESLGSELKGRKLGNYSLASTSSFFVGHHLSTIEGGAVSTDDDDLLRMLKITRAHGWSRNIKKIDRNKLAKKNQINEFYENYSFYELGFNFRPTEISGFIGNCQISYIEEMVNIREYNFKKLYDASILNDNLITLKVKHMNKVSNFAFPLVFKSKEICRKYRNQFKNNNIEIRPIVGGNITQQPFYTNSYGKRNKMNNSEFIHENGFYIPNNPELNSQELKILCDLISKKL